MFETRGHLRHAQLPRASSNTTGHSHLDLQREHMFPLFQLKCLQSATLIYMHSGVCVRMVGLVLDLTCSA
jgi:hypothetical protein